jgi:hypothetical protein
LGADVVVVGDDEFETELCSESGFSDAGNSAVDGDEESAGVFFVELADGGFVESVAFFHAAGDVVVNVGTAELQAVPEQAGAGDAIDVVVTVDGDAAFVRDGSYHGICCGVDSGQSRGVVEVSELCIEEFAGGIGFTAAAGDEDLSEQRGNAELSGEPSYGGGIMRVKSPLPSHDSS